MENLCSMKTLCSMDTLCSMETLRSMKTLSSIETHVTWRPCSMTIALDIRINCSMEATPVVWKTYVVRNINIYYLLLNYNEGKH